MASGCLPGKLWPVARPGIAPTQLTGYHRDSTDQNLPDYPQHGLIGAAF